MCGKYAWRSDKQRLAFFSRAVANSLADTPDQPPDRVAETVVGEVVP